MKISLIGLTYPFRGGISHYSTLLANELSEWHELQFITFNRVYPGFLFPGVTQFDSSQKKIMAPSLPLLDTLNPISWIKAFLEIRAFHPTVVILQWWHPVACLTYLTISLLCKKFSPAPLIFLCHNVLPHEPFPLSRPLTKMVLSQADKFIVQAVTESSKLKDLFPDKKIIQINHPLYTVFHERTIKREVAREYLSAGPDERIVLFFGVVRRYKGLKYLIEAIPYVVRQIACQFYIVGEFYEDEAAYLAQIRRAKVEKYVTIINRYVPNEEVGYYFTACDIVVLPYEDATQSGIIPLAFAFDRPVITTRVGGLPKMVQHGLTGFLVAPKNPEALAQAILDFYREARPTEFRDHIRKAKKKYSWDKVVKIIEEMAG